ncbi:MAG: type IV pilus modification PilV family protein [Thermoleophilia bacterium]
MTVAMMAFWKKFVQRHLGSEAGTSLIELIIATSLLSIAMLGITNIMITSMRTQDKINASFSSQQEARKVLYDMERKISESAAKSAVGGQYAIFQNDAISLPTQNGKWLTYEYATRPGSSSPTLLRMETNSRPGSLPISPSSSSKELIHVGSADITTTVNRTSADAPIFTFYGADGSIITAPVNSPRGVRSVKVDFAVLESKGHAQGESTVSSTLINLRNY